MTKKEIKAQISLNQDRIKRLKMKLEEIRNDINATETAILFWKEELKKVSSKNKTTKGK